MVARFTPTTAAKMNASEEKDATTSLGLSELQVKNDLIEKMRVLYGGVGTTSRRRRGSNLSVTSSNKRRRMDDSDEVLDQVASQVSLESEWEQVLENWNPDKEMLPAE